MYTFVLPFVKQNKMIDFRALRLFSVPYEFKKKNKKKQQQQISSFLEKESHDFQQTCRPAANLLETQILLTRPLSRLSH